MENLNLPPKPPVVPDVPPPTYEYVETKRNWKKILEICAVIVIISIPLVLSLFKIDYSVKRAYEVVNPAYVGTSSDYGTWRNIVTVAKKFIQPVINPTPHPTGTPLPARSSMPQTRQPQREGQQPQHVDQSAPAQDQNWTQYQYPSQVNDSTPYYPADVQMQEPTVMPTPTDEPTWTPTPTLRPTSTPTPRPTSTPTPRPTVIPSPTSAQQNNDQVDAYAAYTACYGKKSNAECFYQSSYGGTVNGKCKTSGGGYLTCVH